MRQLITDKIAQTFPARHGSARLAGHGSDMLVDWQRRHERGNVALRIPGRKRRINSCADWLGSLWRRCGSDRPCRGKRLVNSRPQVSRHRHRRAQKTQRHDRVAIDGDDGNVRLRCQCRRLFGHDEARVVVGHHQTGFLAQPAKQSTTGLGRRLDKRPIVDSALPGGPCVVAHAFENELVQPGACPAIAKLEALIHDQRFAECAGAFEREIERVIVTEPPIGLNPIQHVVAGR